MLNLAFQRLVGLAVAPLLVLSCASAPPAGEPVSSAAAELRLTEYKLGPSDKVRVIVYQEPDLSGEFSIGPTGEISFPLLGEIAAAGLTVQQLRDAVAQELSSGYLNNARVAAEVVSYRPYYILGEVGAPGEYPYSADMTVMKAVAAAGGFSYRARKSSVFIKRADGAEEERYDLTQSLMVFPGDIIRIGERFF